MEYCTHGCFLEGPSGAVACGNALTDAFWQGCSLWEVRLSTDRRKELYRILGGRCTILAFPRTPKVECEWNQRLYVVVAYYDCASSHWSDASTRLPACEASS